MNTIKIILINTVTSLLLISGYHFITADSSALKVLDTEYLLSSNENKVKNKLISLDEYRSRILKAEQYILSIREPVISKYIFLNDKKIPLVYGGNDITDKVLFIMESNNE